MQQLTQTLKKGDIQIRKVPIPMVGPGEVLVRNYYSLISAGTEGSTVKTARKGLIGKAKERPQQAKQVLEVLKSQGPVQTYRAVMKKLDAYSPLGYSSAGEVIEVGKKVRGFSVGDRVACAGNSASHAEVVAIPENLCVKLAEDAELSYACYNTLGAIALQGVRQADLRIGETCAVIGLGLIGQLACMLLRASGVRALGIDVSAAAVESAREHCADAAWVRSTSGLSNLISLETGGLGVDAVIITAGTTSHDPINFAGEIARKRGRVVVVGAAPTGFERDPHWYRKELELRMSCSYGPGRYDLAYEEKGIDYPAAYVRWTEKRNMQAFQELIHSGRIDLHPLTTHRFPLSEAADAYQMILEREEPFLGIVLEYDTSKEIDRSPIITKPVRATGQVGVAFIGAGSYAQGNLLPNLPTDDRITRRTVLTNSGTTSRRVADKYHFGASVSRVEDILSDESTNVVFVVTRHDTHGAYTKQAIAASRHVFAEKPLCIHQNELDEIARLKLAQPLDQQTHLMVGYNRRFAGLAGQLKDHLSPGPKFITYRVNARSIPKESWIQDPEIGGGRIVGEVCHFIDFITWLCESLPKRVYASALPGPYHHQDTLSIVLEFENGSVGTVQYVAIGGAGIAKEMIEVHQAGCSGVLNDFRELDWFAGGKHRKSRSRFQDKGQPEMLKQFFDRLYEGGEPLISLAELYAGMDACFAVQESLKTSAPVEIRRLDEQG